MSRLPTGFSLLLPEMHYFTLLYSKSCHLCDLSTSHVTYSLNITFIPFLPILTPGFAPIGPQKQGKFG